MSNKKKICQIGYPIFHAKITNSSLRQRIVNYARKLLFCKSSINNDSFSKALAKR